jgi:hypothetical protein
MSVLFNTYMRHFLFFSHLRPQGQTSSETADKTEPQLLGYITISGLTRTELCRALWVLTEHARGLIPFLVTHPVKSMPAKNGEAEVISASTKFLTLVASVLLEFLVEDSFYANRAVLLTHDVLEHLLR